MSFGEHLEELRVVLVRSLVFIAIGCVVGFIFAENVVTFLQKPLNDAIGDFRFERSKEKLKAENDGFVPPEIVPILNSKQLAPKTVMVDPGQMVQLLRSISPNAMSEVDITPYRFVHSDFKDDAAAVFCKELQNHSADDPALASRQLAIWDSLTEAEQDVIRRLAEQSTLDSKEQKQLLEILNRAIETERYYEQAVFEPLFVQAEKPWYKFFSRPSDPNPLAVMKERLEQSDVSDREDLSRRLNRLLIANAFPHQLGTPSLRFSELVIWESVEVRSQSLTAPEGFMIWLKAGLISGLFLASPFVFFQIWSFVAAGLYPHEQKHIYIFLPISLGLFFSGAALAFFFVFEPVLNFLFQFNAKMGIDPQPRIGDWLSFVMFLPLGFGIAFQLPLVMFFVSRLGLVSVKTYLEKWRMAVLVIFVLSMVLTPSDPISMIMLAIPLTLLYFLGIAMCYWMPGSRNPFGESYEPA